MHPSLHSDEGRNLLHEAARHRPLVRASLPSACCAFLRLLAVPDAEMASDESEGAVHDSFLELHNLPDAQFILEDIVDEFSGGSFKFAEVQPPPPQHVPRVSQSQQRATEKDCWGGLIMGDGAACTPGFVCSKGHFKNKLCPHCVRHGIHIPVSRVCALPAATTTPPNRSDSGVWNASSTEGGSQFFRIINHTARCVGPRLMIFRDHAPANALAVPESWVRNGLVHLILSKGTLVPAYATCPTIDAVIAGEGAEVQRVAKGRSSGPLNGGIHGEDARGEGVKRPRVDTPVGPTDLPSASATWLGPGHPVQLASRAEATTPSMPPPQHHALGGETGSNTSMIISSSNNYTSQRSSPSTAVDSSHSTGTHVTPCSFELVASHQQLLKDITAHLDQHASTISAERSAALSALLPALHASMAVLLREVSAAQDSLTTTSPYADSSPQSSGGNSTDSPAGSCVGGAGRPQCDCSGGSAEGALEGTLDGADGEGSGGFSWLEELRGPVGDHPGAGGELLSFPPSPPGSSRWSTSRPLTASDGSVPGSAGREEGRMPTPMDGNGRRHAQIADEREGGDDSGSGGGGEEEDLHSGAESGRSWSSPLFGCLREPVSCCAAALCCPTLLAQLWTRQIMPLRKGSKGSGAHRRGTCLMMTCFLWPFLIVTLSAIGALPTLIKESPPPPRHFDLFGHPTSGATPPSPLSSLADRLAAGDATGADDAGGSDDGSSTSSSSDGRGGGLPPPPPPPPREGEGRGSRVPHPLNIQPTDQEEAWCSASQWCVSLLERMRLCRELRGDELLASFPALNRTLWTLNSNLDEADPGQRADLFAEQLKEQGKAHRADRTDDDRHHAAAADDRVRWVFIMLIFFITSTFLLWTVRHTIRMREGLSGESPCKSRWAPRLLGCCSRGILSDLWTTLLCFPCALCQTARHEGLAGRAYRLCSADGGGSAAARESRGESGEGTDQGAAGGGDRANSV